MIRRPTTILLATALVALGAVPAAAATERDLSSDPAEFMASGNDIQDRLGRSLAFGDIDDDGFADLASGAPLDEPAGVDTKDNRGALHIYFGEQGFSGQFSDPDLVIYGEEGCTGDGCALNNNDKSDVLGKGVTMADVDDDGKADLIVSALRAKAVAGVEGGRVGKIYIFFNRGRAGWNSIDGGSAAQADVTIIGDQNQGDIGIHLAAADFDKDGFRDILAGAAAVNSPSPGGLWVIYGRATWPATIDLRDGPVEDTRFFEGADPDDMLGHGVAAGDLNGDGTADIAGGAPFGGAGCGGDDAGKAYVIFGPISPSTAVESITTVADVTVTSDDVGDELGRRVAIGNVGGSSARDLILGAPCGDASGKTDNGVAYVLFGPLTSGTKDADAAANLKVFGEDGNDSLGVDAAAADLNGDGKADLILGADGGDGPGDAPNENRTQAGEVAVLFGSVPTGTRNLATDPADLTVYGDAKDDHLGVFVGAGNVDGAGGADLGMTAPVGSGLPAVGQPQAGEVHVVTGITGTGGGGGGGGTCTILGTSAGETLVGTSGPDVICGKGGKDTLLGKGGSDTLKGGAGADTLDGGGGADTLRGQGGSDTLLGRGGKDDAKGGAGKDTLKGGAGADTLAGGGGDDVVRGNKGNDLLKGGPGDDVLNGGPGTDTCKPGKGNDVLKNCEN